MLSIAENYGSHKSFLNYGYYL